EHETSTPETKPLTYVGPGASATSLKVAPPTAIVGPTGPQQFTTAAFAADESPVNDLPITGWTSSDPTIATVTDAGLAQGVKSGTVTLTAHALNLLSAAATLHVTGPAARVNMICCDAQTAAVGTTVARPFQVQVLSDAGE